MSEPRPRRTARTAYARGAALENRIVAALEEAGFLVTRSAGSKKAADLWAKRADEPLWLVQVRRDGYLSPAEWNTLLSLAEGVGAWAILASAEPRKPVIYRRLLEPCAPYSRRRACVSVRCSTG